MNNERGDRRRSRWLGVVVGLAVIAVAAIIGVAYWLRTGEVVDRFAVPALPATPFLNTGADARYVGSKVCRGCHNGAHRSFHRTGMGRSMAEVDLAREPADATFDHPLSKRRYQVVRRDGQIWHRELLLAGQAEEVLLSEYPLKYVIGSGRHSLTYAVEADGFLVESPLTWYASKKAWGMSPGYDDAKQPGFQRGIGEDCLVCHAGQAQAIEPSWHKMRVSEPAISRERCHGPGSLHVELRTSRNREPAAGIDYTIVNPSHLPRDLAEAVCQQCHLRPTAMIVARGRKLADFRPGLPLSRFKLPYMLDEESGMTVVGHVEQMHMSRCFKGSDTFSCLTCHNPHGEPAPDQRDKFYASICTNCHKPENCTVAPATRQKESPDNNCVQCHMPRAPTEIPHLAFTHHRVGIHKAEARPIKGPGALKPFLDLSWLSEVDRQYALGLASIEAAEQAKDAGQRMSFQRQAYELLTEVRAAGMKDAVLDAALARLHSHMGFGQVEALAESALADPDLDPFNRCNALALVANELVRAREHAKAIGPLRQLILWRRHPIDWLMLSDCEGTLGNAAAAEEAMRTALRINPRLWGVHQHLADQYRRKGKTKGG